MFTSRTYNVDFDNPSPTEREDLRYVRTAEKYGFVVVERRCGYPLEFHLPSNPPKFRSVIWRTVKGWTCADHDNGAYINHRSYETLIAALEAEKS